MNIEAVVVTYHIGQCFLANVESYVSQVDRVWVIDNGSSLDTISAIHAAALKWPGKIELIAQSSNIGLAGAQNIGIKAALAHGADWVVLFDHDSMACEGMIGEMQRIALGAAIHPVGIVAPTIFDINSGRSSVFLVQRKYGFSRKSAISIGEKDVVVCAIASGSMISRSLLEHVGMMNETLFIDYIDTEFVLRAITAGFSVRVAAHAVLNHELGKRSSHLIAGLVISPTNHSPLRKYYMTRNRIWIWPRYIAKCPSFILFDICAFIYDAGRVVIFESNRKSKISMMIKGCHDALAGVLGPYRGIPPT